MLRFAVLAMLACLPSTNARSQEGDPGGTVTLVAAPRLIDPDYRGAVLLAVPVDNNRHVGIIVNRPTGRSLSSLFPEHAIEETPNEARYYVGYVAWRPGELRQEVDRGLWYVLEADPELVFRKDPAGLWEELLRRARAVTAWVPGRPSRVAALPED